MAEFFILRGYRRHGVGVRAARMMYGGCLQGGWEVRVTDNNSVARAFWQRAVSEFTGIPAESALTESRAKDGACFHLSLNRDLPFRPFRRVLLQCALTI